MKKRIFFLLLMGAAAAACSDDRDVLVDLPNDVTFSELQLERFTHQIPESNFTAKGEHSNAVTMNTVKQADGSYSGFAYSNRNNRSFTFTGTPAALDSNIYSVYTKYPNQTGIYTIARVVGEDAFFTLQKPAVVEHILVANTTRNYLALTYGDQKGTPEKPETNDNLPGAADKKGVWYTYVDGGVKKMVDEDHDYFKLIAKGYYNGSQTGTVEFFLCNRKADPAHPDWSLVVESWYKMDLSTLGVVDKVVFALESTDIEAGTGRMRTPPYFCLDGIRIRE